MNEKLESIKDRITDLFSRFIDFIASQWESNRLLFCSACGVLVCIPLLLIVVIGSNGSRTEPVQSSAVVEDYIYLPDELEMGKDYVMTREPEKQWSEEEVRQWFQEPDGKMMNDIRKVNDKLIEDLLEAVP